MFAEGNDNLHILRKLTLQYFSYTLCNYYKTHQYNKKYKEHVGNEECRADYSMSGLDFRKIKISKDYPK